MTALVTGVLGGDEVWSIGGNGYEYEVDLERAEKNTDDHEQKIFRYRRLKLDMDSSRWQYGWMLSSSVDAVGNRRIEFERATKAEYES